MRVIILENESLVSVLGDKKTKIFLVNRKDVRLATPNELKEYSLPMLPHKIPRVLEGVANENIESKKAIGSTSVIADLKAFMAEKGVKEQYTFINACAPTPTGEFLFWSIMEGVTGEIAERMNLKLFRYWITDASENGIRLAVAKATNYKSQDGMNLIRMYRTNYLEKTMDWLVGFNFRRGCKKVFDQTFVNGTTGRKGSPLAKELSESRKSQPEGTELYVTNVFRSNGIDFEGSLYSKGEKLVFPNNNVLRSTLRKQTKKHSVINSQTVEKSLSRARAYNLAEIVQDSSFYFGYSMRQTITTLMSLYKKGAITYPITDSVFINKEDFLNFNVDSFSQYEDLSSFASYFSLKRRAEIADDANYVRKMPYGSVGAIVTTSAFFDKSQTDKVSEVESNLYYLIAKRMLSLFLNDCTVVSTTYCLQQLGTNYCFFISDISYKESDAYLKLYEPEKKFDPSNFEAIKSKPTLISNKNTLVKFLDSFCGKKEDCSYVMRQVDFIDMLASLEDDEKISLDKGAIKVFEEIPKSISALTRFKVFDHNEVMNQFKMFNDLQDGKISKEDCWKRIQELTVEYTNEVLALMPKEKPIDKNSQCENKETIRCPRCGGEIKEYKNAYCCSTDNCLFVSKIIKKAPISFEDAKTLFGLGSINKQIFCRSGEYVPADISFNQKTYSLEFSFHND